MKSPILLAACLVLLVVTFAPGLAAQCTPVPNTGCPGALPPSCGGSSSIGSQLSLTCLDNGRAPFTFLLVGQCEFAPVQFPQFLLCTSLSCNLGVSIGLAVSVPNQFATIVIPVPQSPALVGVQVCSQCVDVVLSRSCLTLGQAVSITVTS
jgi:hypothetical protein